LLKHNAEKKNKSSKCEQDNVTFLCKLSPAAASEGTPATQNASRKSPGTKIRKSGETKFTHFFQEKISALNLLDILAINYELSSQL